MKSTISFLITIFITLTATQAFAPSSISTNSQVRTQREESSSQLHLFGIGEPKDDGSPGDYLCKDCGYVFTKGPAAWAKLDDKYGCPPCGAPKFRFKKVPKGSESGKVEVKKSWFGN